MSKGETPPAKERLEMPVATQKTDTGLTPGLLRVLNKQVSFKHTKQRLKVDIWPRSYFSSITLTVVDGSRFKKKKKKE